MDGRAREFSGCGREYGSRGRLQDISFERRVRRVDAREAVGDGRRASAENGDVGAKIPHDVDDGAREHGERSRFDRAAGDDDAHSGRFRQCHGGTQAQRENRDVTPRKILRNEVAGRSIVEDHALPVVDQTGGGLGQKMLRLQILGFSKGKRVGRSAFGGAQRAAVNAGDEALVRQLLEIAAYCHGRDAGQTRERCDAHGFRPAQRPHDCSMTLRGQLSRIHFFPRFLGFPLCSSAVGEWPPAPLPGPAVPFQRRLSASVEAVLCGPRPAFRDDRLRSK